MLNAVHGSLTIVNPNLSEMKVFWRGTEVEGIQKLRVHHDQEESHVKIVLQGTQQHIYDEMIAAGISVKNLGA